MSDITHIIKPLSQDERLACEMQAKETVRKSLEEPVRRVVTGETSSYPAYVVKWIWVGMGIVFVASALPSFFRLFTAGRDYFLMGIDDHWQATLVGFATFMLAEFLIILSTVASRVLFTRGDKIRQLFYVPMVIGFLIALEGNRIIEKPHDLFGWLMTVAPPIAVLSIAVITEHIILDKVKNQHDADVHYKAQYSQYRQWYDNPTAHTKYIHFYADNLQKAIAQKNVIGTGAKERRELMQGLTAMDWSRLVKREFMLADGWYQNGVNVDVSGDDAPMNVTISTSRARLPQMAGDGDVNPVHFTEGVQNVQENIQHTPYKTKTSPKLEKVLAHLENNPNDATLSSRKLSELFEDIGHMTCAEALRIFNKK